jgi:hypothetical protein
MATIGLLHHHKPGTEAGRLACSEQRSICLSVSTMHASFAAEVQWNVSAVWGVVILPIVRFGQVLYPSRTRAEKEVLTKTSCRSEQCIYYVDPDSFSGVGDLVHQALRSDWTLVVPVGNLIRVARTLEPSVPP